MDSNDEIICFGEYIPPHSGYKPPKLKWYQNMYHYFYNIREYIIIALCIIIWSCLIIVGIRLGWGREIAFLTPLGLLSGVILGLHK